MVIMTKDHGGQLRPLDLKCISSIHTWNKVVWTMSQWTEASKLLFTKMVWWCANEWNSKCQVGKGCPGVKSNKWAATHTCCTLKSLKYGMEFSWLFSSESVVVTTGFKCVDLSAIQSSGKQQPYSEKHAMLFVLKTQAMLPCCAFICDWQLEEWFWQWHACHKQVVSIHRINLHYIDLNTVLPTAKPHHVYYLYRLGPTP